MPWNNYDSHWTGSRAFYHPAWLLEAINGRTWTINGSAWRMALLKEPPRYTRIGPEVDYTWWNRLTTYEAIQAYEVEAKPGYDYVAGGVQISQSAGIDLAWPYSRLLLVGNIPRWERLNDSLYCAVIYEDDTPEKHIVMWVPFTVSGYYWATWQNAVWGPPLLCFNQPFQMEWTGEGIQRWYGGPYKVGYGGSFTTNFIYPNCMFMAMTQPDWETAKISLMEENFGFYPLDHDYWNEIEDQGIPGTDQLVGYRHADYYGPSGSTYPGDGAIMSMGLFAWNREYSWNTMYLANRTFIVDGAPSPRLTASYGKMTTTVGGMVLHTDNSLISGIEFSPLVTLIDEYISVTMYMTVNMYEPYPNPPDP